MQTANPVLARIDRDAAQASRSGAGFAYEEGRSAVASAQYGTAAPAPAPAPTGDDAGIYSGVQIPAPAGQRVTYADVMVKSAIMFAIAFWDAAERRSAQYATFHGYRPLVPDGDRIDWILTSPTVRTHYAAINPYSRDGQFPSDHHPVLARLRLR